MEIQIQSCQDLEFLSRMLNHPDIYPFIKDDAFTGSVDCTSLLEDFLQENLLMKIVVDGHEAGFVFFLRTDAGVLEQHSGLLPDYRGHLAVFIGRAVINIVMQQTDCREIDTWCWSNARHVALMARKVGFTERDRSPWPNLVQGQKVERIRFSITRSEWAANQTKAQSIQN